MPNGQYPAILAGQNAVASLIQAFAPLTAYKTVDTSRATFTTLTNDPDLTLPVAANATYEWSCFLNYEGGTQGASDITLRMFIPTGSLLFQALGLNTAGALAGLGIRAAGSTNPFGTGGAGVLFGLNMWGTLAVGGTGGNCILQWAQNTSSATPTIVHTGSRMTLRRIA